VFYAVFAKGFLVLIGALVIATYLLLSFSRPWSAIMLLIGVLFYFKLQGEAVTIAALTITHIRPENIMIPLGLSFLTFELIHFAIERSRSRLSEVSLVDLIAFAFFFPCRIAGPIKRYPDFMAAVSQAKMSSENVYRGIVRILAGLFKKIVLADTLGLIVSDTYPISDPILAWTAVIAYSFQIYFDFSAYSDIAIGSALLMGIRIPENFSYPYLAKNIQEFWQRWHISLSTWLRDYIFMGLGQRLFKTSMKAYPALLATVCYVVTFFIAGAWHGLAANFLAWGLYHGILLATYHLYRSWLPVTVATHPLYQSRAMSLTARGITFVLVSVGWVFFMTNLKEGTHLLQLMFGI
jgi:alginate O-acetyltransferase complex protein AlgI